MYVIQNSYFTGSMGLFIRLMICILIVGTTLYKYIDKMNALTELRLSIPVLNKEMQEIREKNIELGYLIECFESPLHLMELAHKPEFGHLKYPPVDSILIISNPSVHQPPPENQF